MSPKAPLSFSIVMPTLDRKDVVCDALRAIDNIEYEGPFEVVLVIDGSRDGTAEGVTALGLKAPLHVIEQANCGAAAARNRGAKQATGEILLFLDDDMMCQPDILTHFARAFDDGADAAMGDIPIDPTSPDGMLKQCVGAWARDRAEQLARSGVREFADILSGQLAVRRTLFHQLGGFDAQFTGGGGYGNEDLDFGVRLTAACRTAFVPEAVSLQRYVVTPRHNLEQCFQTGVADRLLIAKHPHLAGRIEVVHVQFRTMAHIAAALPGISWLIANSAVLLESIAYGRLTAANKSVIRYFEFAREVCYRAGRLAH